MTPGGEAKELGEAEGRGESGHRRRGSCRGPWTRSLSLWPLLLLIAFLPTAAAVGDLGPLAAYGFERFFTTTALAASGLCAVNSGWAQTRKDKAAEARMDADCDAWDMDTGRAVGIHGMNLWRCQTGTLLEMRAQLRDRLLELMLSSILLPDSSAARARVVAQVVGWQADTDELLAPKPRVQSGDREELWWKGDPIGHREQVAPLAGSTRVMFLNLRRMKRGIEGGLLRGGIWDFAAENDLDWVGLSDHWLVVPPGGHGKWDRSGLGCPHRQLYKASGVQAAVAKGYDGMGWGGDNMLWTIGQGLPGSDDPVGGTLMATRSGWNRADRELVDGRGWGRYSGRKIVGVGGRAVILLQVQGPCKGSLGKGPNGSSRAERWNI